MADVKNNQWEQLPPSVRAAAEQKYETIRALLQNDLTDEKIAELKLSLANRKDDPTLMVSSKETAKAAMRAIKHFDVMTGKWEEWSKACVKALSKHAEADLAEAVESAKILMGPEAAKRADLLEGGYESLQAFLEAMGSTFEVKEDAINKGSKMVGLEQKWGEKGTTWFRRYIDVWTKYGDRAWTKEMRLTDFMQRTKPECRTLLKRDKVDDILRVLECFTDHGDPAPRDDSSNATTEVKALVTSAERQECKQCGKIHQGECWSCTLRSEKGHRARFCPKV